ncbi:MAG: serine hydrolase domain-containing protein [Chloroflexota bacterium]
MVAHGWERRFEEYAADLIARSGIPSAAVALARNGETIYEAGFGHRDAEGRLPVTPDTRFGLGSVTKSFPCLCIVQLAEAGALSVHDPVVTWLPEFRLPGAAGAEYTPRVTIHHLMTHAAGIPPEPSLLHARAASIVADPDLNRMHPVPMGVPPDIRSWERITTYEELMALMARQDFAVLGPPGSVISYSNEGFVLLAAIVERVTGQGFGAYLQAHVLDPLEMARTGLYTRKTPPDEPEVVPFAVDTRSGAREVFPSPAWWDQGTMFGNGGLKSTTRDLLHYLELYRTDGASHGTRVISPDGVRQMTVPHQPIPTASLSHGGYGYGLRIDQIAGLGTSIGHGGGNKGVATQVLAVPELGLTAVALTNLANAPAAKLAQGMILAAAGRAPEGPWIDYPEHAVNPSALARYVGAYQGQPGSISQVTVRDGALYVASGAEPQLARPYAPGSFYLEAADEVVTFLERPSGEVWAMASGLRTFPRINL